MVYYCDSAILQIIAASCKKLKCFIIESNIIIKHKPAFTIINMYDNLEQFLIESKQAIVTDELMKSAYGQLT